MKIRFIIIFCTTVFFSNCNIPVDKLEMSIDPDIVLINIEDGGRASIGEILLKLDSLDPVIVGIDVRFQGRKKQDSALIKAFRKLKNDILIYNINPDGSIYGSDSVFTSLTDQGYLYYEERLGLISTIVPLQKIKDSIHESFAYKMIKRWKPGFNSQIKVNEKIDIHYTRNMDKFFKINGSELLATPVHNYDLSNKVFLVGYIGPNNDDKHFTSLRFADRTYKNNEPDTYGLVIIANEIRTILEKKSQ